MAASQRLACLYMFYYFSLLLRIHFFLLVLFLNFVTFSLLGEGTSPHLGPGVEVKECLVGVKSLLSLHGASDGARSSSSQGLYLISQLTGPVSGFLFFSCFCLETENRHVTQAGFELAAILLLHLP